MTDAANAALQKSLATLRSPDTIRDRCHELLALAEADHLTHFIYNADRLPVAADYVCQTITANYPSGDIPFHSRWRHFKPDEVDRWAKLATQMSHLSPDAVARSQFDLVITSVLLDAGAGNTWQYVEPSTGKAFGRSEGLAVASFDLFTQGVLSADPKDPYRVDAQALLDMRETTLAEAFQVRADNPLVGVAGRTKLLQSLGACLQQFPELFGAEGRLGNLYDVFKQKSAGNALPASEILELVLTSIGNIWPGRLMLQGHNLGDVWQHSRIKRGDATTGLVPFHKLSQWLSYSLMEPLTQAGISVTDLDALTGLAEYRNGGLFVDLDVLTLKDPDAANQAYDIGDELVVEWRALSLALLDRMGHEVRARLGLDAKTLPLVKVLEGGTWSAGRRLAFARSTEGAPPILIKSDGTVF